MKTKNKQTTRTRTEPEKWTSQGGFSVGMGRGRGRMGGKIQEIRSIVGRHKIDVERLRIVNRELEELICTTHEHELSGREC